MMKYCARMTLVAIENRRYMRPQIEQAKRKAFTDCMAGLFEDINNKGRFEISVSTFEKVICEDPEVYELETIVKIASVE